MEDGPVFEAKPEEKLSEADIQAALNFCEKLILKRMEYCNHLCIQNTAPELIEKVCAAMYRHKNGIVRCSDFDFVGLDADNYIGKDAKPN